MFKSLLFLCSGSIEQATGTRQLKEMGGLGERMPVTRATCTIASLSIAGVPPFNGFWSKLIIIIAAFQASVIAWAGGHHDPGQPGDLDLFPEGPALRVPGDAAENAAGKSGSLRP